MTTLFFLALATFLSFIFYVLTKVGIKKLPSLSDSYYQLKNKGYLFQIALSLTAILLIPIMIELTPKNFQVIGFFVPSALVFTAFAPKFGKIWNYQQKKMIPENELERKVHQKSATYSAITSLIWVIIVSVNYNLLLLLTIPICSLFAFTLYIFFNQKIFFSEMACFGWTLATVFILIL